MGGIAIVRIMSLGDRIRRARRARGMSQEALANACGVSRPAVTQWEQNNGTKPDLVNLERLPSILGTSAEWLLTGRGESGLPPPHTGKKKPPERLNLASSGSSGVGTLKYQLTHDAEPLLTVAVRGDIQGGAFMIQQGVDELPREFVTFRPKRFENLDHAAWLVHGNSMNLAGIVDGSYVITVPYHTVRTAEAGQKGDLVVVERRRRGEIERTCKEVGRSTPAGLELIPRSTEPHDTIIVPVGGEDDDGTEVEIIGLVVGGFKHY